MSLAALRGIYCLISGAFVTLPLRQSTEFEWTAQVHRQAERPIQNVLSWQPLGTEQPPQMYWGVNCGQQATWTSATWPAATDFIRATSVQDDQNVLLVWPGLDVIHRGQGWARVLFHRWVYIHPVPASRRALPWRIFEEARSIWRQVTHGVWCGFGPRWHSAAPRSDSTAGRGPGTLRDQDNACPHRPQVVNDFLRQQQVTGRVDWPKSTWSQFHRAVLGNRSTNKRNLIQLDFQWHFQFLIAIVCDLQSNL